MISLLFIPLLSCSCLGAPTAPAGNPPPSVTNTSVLQSFNGVCDTYLAGYMANMWYNFIPNDGQRCVSVATHLALSYYDTYLNDNIINDGYEIQSTVTVQTDGQGIVWNIMAGQGDAPGPGATYDPSNTKPGQTDYGSDDVFNILTDTSSAAVNTGEGMYRILQKEEVNDLFIPDDTTRDEAYELLDEGTPVFIRYIDSVLGDHTVLAFDYDTDGNILCHNGYAADDPVHDTFKVISHDANVVEFLYLSPRCDIPHVCSDNFVSADGTPYCPCLMDGWDLSPSHVHTDSYLDSIWHASTCPSTLMVSAKCHSYSVVEGSQTHSGHQEICSCGNSVFQAHTPDEYEVLNDLEHRLHFGDGCYLDEAHRISVIYPYGRDIHRAECVCGAMGQQHHFTFFEIEYNGYDYPVCGCGFTTLPGGLTQEEMVLVQEWYLESLEEE